MNSSSSFVISISIYLTPQMKKKLVAEGLTKRLNDKQLSCQNCRLCYNMQHQIRHNQEGYSTINIHTYASTIASALTRKVMGCEVQIATSS